MFYQFRSSIHYITFTVAYGLLVDLAIYGLIVPVLPFRLVSIGYHNISAKSSFLVAAYAGGLIISSIPVGILGDIIKNRKTPLLICLVFLAASLILFWRSTSFPVLIISRILQGFSGTGIWTLGLALICDTVPESQLGIIMGYVMIGWSIGSVIGPLAGGVLYDSLGYNSIFVFALILTAIDFILRLLVVDQADRERYEVTSCEVPQLTPKDAVSGEAVRSNVANLALQGPDVVMLATVLAEKKEEIETNGKGTTTPLISLSEPQPAPLKSSTSQALLSLARSPRCWTLFTIIFVLGFAFGGLLDAGMTIVLHHRYGLNSRGAGLVFIGAVIPSFASSPLAGHLADKYGAKWPVITCLGLGTPFFSLLSLRGTLLSFVAWISLTGLFIMGIAAPIMEDLSQVVKISPGLGHAHVYSIFNMVYSIGAMVGPLCIGALIEHIGIQKGWMISCYLTTALCAACILPSWLYIGDKRQISASTITTVSQEPVLNSSLPSTTTSPV